MTETQDSVRSLGEYAAVLRRRWQFLALIVPPAVMFAIFMAFSLPALYQSSATIMLEPSSISPDLVKTTVISYADGQIELVRRAVMTPNTLETVVGEIDPYQDRKDLSARDKARMIIDGTGIQKVDPVTGEPMVISSAFSVSYVNPDPAIAAEVTRHIANLFLDYNRTSRITQARNAHDFLMARSDELNNEILKLEQRISEFKSRYGDALPESRDRNEFSLDRVQRDLDSVEGQIRVVSQQEALLKLQLKQISPTLVASANDPYTQLGLLRAELAAAKQKYTPDHPDVKRLTRAIEELAAQANIDTPTPVRPNNPEYLRIAAELNAVQQNLAALNASASRARTQIADYNRRLNLTPTVERDYAQLTRDHENARQQFNEIQSKLRAAETAQQLESTSQGERYTLIRGATQSSRPVSPNRLGIVLIGVILGSALAIGLAVFAESADPTVRSARDYSELGAEVPLLGSVPVLRNAAERHRMRLVWGSVAGVYAVSAIGVAITVLRQLH